MNRLTVRKKIGVPADRAWEIVSQYAEAGPDRCQPFGTVAGKVAGWVDGAGVPTGFMDRALPLKSARLDVTVRHAGADSSEVTVTMDYAVGSGPIGALIHAVAMRPAMRKTLRRAIDGIACRVSLSAGAEGAGSSPLGGGVLREGRAVFAV
jgi:hypothetical protein